MKTFKRVILALLLALGGLALAEDNAPVSSPPTADHERNRDQDDLQFEVRFELAGSERSLVGEIEYAHPLSLNLFSGGVWAVLQVETRYDLGEMAGSLETQLRLALEVDTEYLTPYLAVRTSLIGFQHQHRSMAWEIGIRGGIDLR